MTDKWVELYNKTKNLSQLADDIANQIKILKDNPPEMFPYEPPRKGFYFEKNKAKNRLERTQKWYHDYKVYGDTCQIFGTGTCKPGYGKGLGAEHPFSFDNGALVTDGSVSYNDYSPDSKAYEQFKNHTGQATINPCLEVFQNEPGWKSPNTNDTICYFHVFSPYRLSDSGVLLDDLNGEPYDLWGGHSSGFEVHVYNGYVGGTQGIVCSSAVGFNLGVMVKEPTEETYYTYVEAKNGGELLIGKKTAGAAHESFVSGIDLINKAKFHSLSPGQSDHWSFEPQIMQNKFLKHLLITVAIGGAGGGSGFFLFGNICPIKP